MLLEYNGGSEVTVSIQVSFVGLTEEAAREQAEKDGYADKVAVVKTSFKANSKVGKLGSCLTQRVQSRPGQRLSTRSLNSRSVDTRSMHRRRAHA